MSGDWPPEWQDPSEEFPSEDNQLDAAAEERLSEVTAYLASVPAPGLPDAVAARIGAALAAEAATRAGGGGQAKAPSPGDAEPADTAVPAAGARTLGSTPARARVRRRLGREGGAAGGPRGFRSRPFMAAGAAVACLLLAGVGYGLSRVGSSPASQSFSASGSSSSSGKIFAGPAVPIAGSAGASATAGASKQEAAAPASSAPSGPAFNGSAPSPAASSIPARSSGTTASASPTATPSLAVPSPSGTAGVMSFGVAASGTKYQQATLAAQVQTEIAAYRGLSTVAPSSALRGCVLQLTGGQSPKLVDHATYQGEQSYVIASSARVWVVGLGCTAANPELIVSQSLAG